MTGRLASSCIEETVEGMVALVVFICQIGNHPTNRVAIFTENLKIS